MKSGYNTDPCPLHGGHYELVDGKLIKAGHQSDKHQSAKDAADSPATAPGAPKRAHKAKQ